MNKSTGPHRSKGILLSLKNYLRPHPGSGLKGSLLMIAAPLSVKRYSWLRLKRYVRFIVFLSCLASFRLKEFFSPAKRGFYKDLF
jgi:hypothetical protein